MNCWRDDLTMLSTSRLLQFWPDGQFCFTQVFNCQKLLQALNTSINIKSGPGVVWKA